MQISTAPYLNLTSFVTEFDRYNDRIIDRIDDRMDGQLDENLENPNDDDGNNELKSNRMVQRFEKIHQRRDHFPSSSFKIPTTTQKENNQVNISHDSPTNNISIKDSIEKRRESFNSMCDDSVIIDKSTPTTPQSNASPQNPWQNSNLNESLMQTTPNESDKSQDCCVIERVETVKNLSNQIICDTNYSSTSHHQATQSNEENFAIKAHILNIDGDSNNEAGGYPKKLSPNLQISIPDTEEVQISVRLKTPPKSPFRNCSKNSLPFWYGTEDELQLRYYMQQRYASMFAETEESVKAMQHRQWSIGRKLLFFVGRVHRIVEHHSNDYFSTIDQVFIYRLDCKYQGNTFPLHTIYRVACDYNRFDGTISNSQHISHAEYKHRCAKIEDGHSHTTYLFQQPRSNIGTLVSLDDFDFRVSGEWAPETHSHLVAQAIVRNYSRIDEEDLLEEACDEDIEEMEFCLDGCNSMEEIANDSKDTYVFTYQSTNFQEYADYLSGGIGIEMNCFEVNNMYFDYDEDDDYN